MCYAYYIFDLVDMNLYNELVGSINELVRIDHILFANTYHLKLVLYQFVNIIQ
jgi:hypothetical protein